jgi:cytochrome c peroxidase
MQLSPRPVRAAVFAACLASSALQAGCKPNERSSQSSPPPSSAASTSASAAIAEAPAKRPAPTHEGGALARAVGEEALYLADEDQGMVRRVPLPFDSETRPVAVKMPGAPAAVLALDGLVLITIRDPGLLLLMRPDQAAVLVEIGRVELPADAWGIAVTPDEKIAIVTSAWTHKVSAVDLASAKKLWTVDVSREPRGVTVLPDGKSAYVSHLVKASLTRIDDLGGDPRVRAVPFPAAPIRTIPDRAEAATLGYAPVLSPDGSRLFLARHALGATGKRAWNGQATVDVLLTADETPLAQRPARWFIMKTRSFMKQASDFGGMGSDRDMTTTGPGPLQMEPPFIQPRAVVYRKKTRTLLVASEGTDRLVELDALSIDPSTQALKSYDVGLTRNPASDVQTFVPQPGEPVGVTRCGAPTGIALSADETKAFVFCRGSRHLASVELDAYDGSKLPQAASQAAADAGAPDASGPEVPLAFSSITRLALGDEPLPEQAALGRRLFYNAVDGFVSGGYGCAGCHPEGRDDGHVWHEDAGDDVSGSRLHAFEMDTGPEGFAKGAPRQTPMLAGRVSAKGPYGWKGHSPSLRHRLLIGLKLHRWGDEAGSWTTGDRVTVRAEPVVEFLRKGLVPPPREARDLTEVEQRGRQVFNDPNVGCADCHVPKSEYTNRVVTGLGEWIVATARFDKEPGDDWRFKTPSLLYIGGTPPYYHDGSSATLEELLFRNGNRMGHTQHLSKADKAALAAFLKTL